MFIKQVSVFIENRAGRLADLLDILAKNIDELVIQSYQGNHTVSNYLDYLKRVTALKLPYKVGLVQHGLISKHHFFETDVNFKGYVIFLLRSKARS